MEANNQQIDYENLWKIKHFQRNVSLPSESDVSLIVNRRYHGFNNLLSLKFRGRVKVTNTRYQSVIETTPWSQKKIFAMDCRGSGKGVVVRRVQNLPLKTEWSRRYHKGMSMYNAHRCRNTLQNSFRGCKLIFWEPNFRHLRKS